MLFYCRFVGVKRSGSFLILDIYPGDLNKMNASVISGENFKLKTVDVDTLTRFRHMAEISHDNTAYGVEFIVAEFSSQCVIEFFDGSLCPHRKTTFTMVANVLPLICIMLIIYFTNYLFKYIFDSYKTGDSTVLVKHDCHVVTIGTEFL